MPRVANYERTMKVGVGVKFTTKIASRWPSAVAARLGKSGGDYGQNSKLIIRLYPGHIIRLLFPNNCENEPPTANTPLMEQSI